MLINFYVSKPAYVEFKQLGPQRIERFKAELRNFFNKRLKEFVRAKDDVILINTEVEQ